VRVTPGGTNAKNQQKRNSEVWLELFPFRHPVEYAVKPDAHVPFHGYYFHMLNGQSSKARSGANQYLVDGKMVGGFAFVAYPAEYGNSGIMTFMINQGGALLEKDLGKTTTQTATATTEFDPDEGWSVDGLSAD
jgi:hypothetical protein